MNKQTAHLLEQHFDTAFAAPDGIAKLRELFLTLAMQGKLVEQDANDPPASELLKEIESEKQRFHSSSSPRRRGSSGVKGLDSRLRGNDGMKIKPEEVPYELPQGWEWVRLGDIGVWKSGSTPSRSNANFYGGDIPWVKSGEVKQGRIKSTEETITQAALDKCPLQINEKGSVLVAMYGANIGEVGILEIEATTNQAVCACKTYTNFDENYLLYLITFLKPYFLSQGAGAAQPNISRGKIVATIFPLPPLPEQHRIVARIDQLMARCDALKKLRKVREEKRLAVHAATIKQLLDSDPSFPRRRESSSSEELDPRLRGGDEKGRGGDGVSVSAWDFIQQHFGELYTVKENVAELRKAILQLAVMGRLVPQNPNDPPASELLKEIEKEKVSREGAKARRGKEKKLPPIKPEEVPYQLPQGWEWVRFGSVASTRLGKMLDKAKNRGHLKPYLRNTNVQWHQFVLDDVKEMKFEDSELDEFRIVPGDLLICEGGEPGRCAIWSDPKLEIYFQKAIHKARPFSCVTSEFLQVCLTNDAGNGQLDKYFTGATIKHFPGDKLNGYVIPLPSIPEQHRIVARIDQLMALCDSLDQQIDAATVKQAELLGAVMAQV